MQQSIEAERKSCGLLSMVAALTDWAPMLRAIAWMIRLSIAFLERVHARNRSRTHQQTHFGVFAAMNVLSELKLRRDAMVAVVRRSQQQQAEDQQSGDGLRVQPPPEEAERLPLRKQ